MKQYLRITIENKLSEIETVVEKIAAFCKANKLSDKVANHVDLALDEILNNIIRHGYSDNDPHEIQIILNLEKDTLHIEVEDDGKSFNPLKSEEADTKSSLEERAVGGLGLHFVKKFMDGMDYHYANKKNRLSLTKNITK